MEKTLISIILPIFNRGELIKETLDSVLSQTYRNWECIIIDDGSTDNSFEVVSSFMEKDPRVKFFKREIHPKGAPTCRELGKDLSKGDLIIFLDSDDLLAPWALEERMEYFQKKPELNVLLSNGLQFNSKTKRFLNYCALYNEPEILKSFLKMNVVFQTTSPTWKKEFLVKHNIQWDVNLPCWQDVDYAIQAFSNNPIFHWASELPDYFLRKEDDPNALTSLNDIVPKVVSNFYTYEKWLKNKSNSTLLKDYFPDYMLRKLEFLLPERELAKMILEYSDIIEKYLGVRTLRYLRLFNKTRNVKFVRGFIYRARPILAGIDRKLCRASRVNFNSKINASLFTKLKEHHSGLFENFYNV